MQVCVPSTPAQMFHMLRRQMKQRVPQAAHRHDAEEPAASQAVGVAARGSDARQLPQRHRRDRRHPAGQGHARRVLLRQGVLRPARIAPRRRRCTTSRSCASSSCIRSRPRSTPRSIRKYPQRARDRLVPGRAAEPGRAGTRSAIACRSRCRREHQLLYAGRAPAAAPATGIAQMHMEQQQAARRRSAALHQHRRDRCGRPRRLRAAGEK